jgi:hypothetical protein
MTKLISKLLLLLLLSILLSPILKAQTDTIDNKIIVKNYPRQAYPFHDLDNNSFYFANFKSDGIIIYQIDNDLNIIDSIINPINPIAPYPLFFKLNNLLYGTDGSVKGNNNIGSYTIDSIYFYYNDLNGNNINTKLIYTESENNDSNSIATLETTKTFVTKENNIALLLVAVESDVSWRFPRLLIVDTLGQRVGFKDYKALHSKKSTEYAISEKDDFFVLYQNPRNFTQTYNTKVFYIDKSTLEIIDSDSFDTPIALHNFKTINDSISITISPLRPSTGPDIYRYYIKILNEKQVIQTDSIMINIDSLSFYDYYIPDYQTRVDCINDDSIYYCTFLNGNTGIYDPNYSGVMQILNFGVDGNINFDYRIILDTFQPIQINGVKATSDGGLFATLYNLITGTTNVIKFMPNGFIGLINIETGEKETIKVYPNPAKDFVYVDIEASNFEKGEVELFDMQGKLVKKAKLSAKQGNRVDVSNLNAGAYTYNVSLNGKTISGKVIVGK